MRASQNLFLRQTEILDDPQMWKQLKMLKHHTDAGAHFRQICLGVVDPDAVQDDFPALDRLQRVDAFDQCRFARARRAAHHHHLALGDAGGAILQRLKARPVPFVDVTDFDHDGLAIWCGKEGALPLPWGEGWGEGLWSNDKL